MKDSGHDIFDNYQEGQGICPVCDGRGEYDVEDVVDMDGDSRIITLYCDCPEGVALMQRDEESEVPES